MIEHTDPWQADAACRQYDPDLWHLDEHASADAVEITEQARAVCAGCPVRAQCLAEAMTDPHLTGVWGATTHTERDRARRSGRDAAARRAGGVPVAEPDPPWTQETVRFAHSARHRGETTTWALEGDQAYQRMRRHQQHLNAAAAAEVPA